VSIPNLVPDKAYNIKEFQNLAAYVQNQLSKWSLIKCADLVERTGITNICVGGGVGLNSIMNHYLEKNLQMPVFAPPFPSDQGQALGNAIFADINLSLKCFTPHIEKQEPPSFAYLGQAYSTHELSELIKNILKDNELYVYETDDATSITARLLTERKIIGWFQGKSEYGARALGNRSIIADPRTPEMKDKVNGLKGRESFRPLAPSGIEGFLEDYFEDTDSILLPYMLGVVPVKKKALQKVPAIVHVDNTARLQVVTKKINPKYYKLIKEFFDLTGIPIILNTSFNAAGDPIVENYLDAYSAFKKMPLDVLILENFIISKKELEGLHDIRR
jgi:carbamoyltransferase